MEHGYGRGVMPRSKVVPISSQLKEGLMKKGKGRKGDTGGLKVLC